MVAVIPAAVRTPAVLAAFAAYGALWGPYLATLPDVQRATGADAAQLGLALTTSALLALPAMVVVGRLLDRFGRSIVLAVTAGFALVSVGPSVVGSVPSLLVAMALFGFGSGACNVVVVALAASAETGGTRIMNRAHALFSIGLLVGSLGTGAARAQGVPGPFVAVAVAVVVIAYAVVAHRRTPAVLVRTSAERDAERGAGRGGVRGRLRGPLLVLSLLAAAGMVVESGVQQWSSVFLSDVTRATVGLAATAPGVFAAAMAAGRLSGHWLAAHASERWLLIGSGATAAVGVLLLSVVSTPTLGLLGVALVGGAVSICTPTAYSLIGRHAAEGDRGAVLGAAGSLASVGLLLGPAAVGQVAQHASLPTAVAALSVVAVAICLLALRVTERARHV